MKKLTVILLLMFGAFSISNAQSTKTKTKAKTSVSKQDKAAMAAQKKADKDAKALAKKQAKEAKANAATTTAPTTNMSKPVANATPRTSAAKTADKAIGTDAKGRTLYQGPRGGKYYLTSTGHKEYVK